MSLRDTGPGCGTPLGYDGLCWKCKCERDRNAALVWTPEHIAEKQKNPIENIRRLTDMEDPELTDFWQLLGCRDTITPEIQRSELAAGVFYPNGLYYRAPDDVRNGLPCLSGGRQGIGGFAGAGAGRSGDPENRKKEETK